MPRFTRFGTLPSYALRGLIAFALALLTLHPSLPVRDASAAIRSDDVDRIGRPTLVAPADKAQMAETAVRFAYEVPSGWGKAQLIVSRRPFDPSGWTRIEAESDMKVAELANGIVSLADAGVALDSDTRLWWAIAVEEQGTGRLKVSEVRSFNAVRKFSNRVAPHPLLKEGRRGTLSPTDLLSAPRANGEAAGAAPRIRLAAGYDFAPSVQLPALPSDLASIQAPREESSQSGLRAYLVQFAAPPSAGEMAAIAKAGGSVFCYVPDQAYLVRMTEQGRAQLDAQAKPAWIGDYQPAYKLSPRLDRAQAQVMPFSTLLFPDADIAAVRATLTELGIEVFSQSDNGINKLLRFRAAGPELAKVAAISSVAWVEPVANFELHNANAQFSVQTNASANRRVWDMGIRGQGEVVTTSDSGVRASHQQFVMTGSPILDFGDYPTHRKIIAYKRGSDNPGVAFGDHAGSSYHGTHTAGTICGSDDPTANVSLNDGMAKDAKLYFMDISGPALANGVAPPDDLNDLFLPAYVGNAGGAARISSNSWGAAVFGAYDLNALNVDQFAWAHPDFYIGFSNGNAGAPGSVGSPAVAKNCAGMGGTANGTGTGIYASTSRGPTADGRLKPTFATPGLNLISANGSGTSGYIGLSGTSMASPSGSGAVALIRQYLREGWYPTGAAVPANGFAPSAALLKAMAINGSNNNVTGGFTAPDNNIGWGKLSADSVLYFASDIRKLLLVDFTDGLGQTQFIEYQINVVDNTMPFEVSLCWTDYPGNPASSIQLVNNLDLTVTKGADVYRGNVYGVGTGLSVTGGAYDNLNVEEGVRISAPATGIWTVRVAAPVVPFDPQAFGLVLTGGIGDAAGALALDRGQYGSTSVVELQVIDTNAGPTVSVDVTSTTEGTAETVVLTGGNGVFTGTLPLTPAEVTTGNGVLSVSHGDQITATYLDASPSATLSASATVSYQTPIITNVQAASAGGSATRITWDTDINATTRVYYGLTPALELGSVTETGAPFAHSVLLTGLTPGSTYYFDVESASLEGNVTRDDRGGAHYTFTAKPSGDVLMVFGTDEFERKVAWDSALMDGAYDYDVWSGPLADAPALGDLNGGLRSYRAVLWQPGLEQYPPFTDGAQTVLTDYLNGGGRLLVCGHDIAWAFGDPTSPVYNATRNAWLQNTLRTIWLQDPTTWSSIIGVGGDPISGAHTGGVAYTPIRDGGAGDEVNVNQAAGGTGDMVWLNNDASPDSIGFRWESGTPNGSGATAVWGGLPSRLATMYYEFTAMTPPFTSPSATRTAILDKTIQWLYGREKPTVTITAPNGGEIITTSSTNITWNETVGPSRAVASRKLEYSLDGGQSWVLIANGVGPSPYNWDLTSVPNSNAALVRIRNTDDGAPALHAQDASSTVFTLNRSGGDVLGPVVVAGSINASPNPIVRPNPATLNARVSEATTGGSTVTAAEWSFGNAPAPAGNGTAMTGAFGTVVVDVSAALNTTPFQTGPQKLWVRGQDANGNWGPATALDIQINGPPPVGVDETPTVAFLRQNTPNPFAGTTAIRFGLPHTGPVDLGIFDVAGRLVRQLVDAPLAAGLHTATWDRTDAQGVRVKPGIYYYRLITPTSRFEKRLVALN